ncbi:hypothetical protein CLM85_27895 [Streptomyces albidoflavus]|nr:hypothetical protein CLM83_16400 [Streptomyces albidoflavus]PBO21450.1 hypothetical protein CLM85_27895 [Streptomyces albidoflavus]PBO29743.1 hypothetical protein CLM84_12220 [Streptomyces albidoflavus]RZF06019.1 hypothetical protein C0R05_24620 [Streptomyces albidoflavus]
MARGCRDCRTCTRNLIGRWMWKLIYLCTFAWLVKPVVMRNCPQCKHLLSAHERRRDGSFKD